jgi:hypothetical protein
MESCPRCGYRPDSASEDAFKLFHALRDEYATAQGMSKIEAKDQLCVMFGISVEYEGQADLPKWPMVACRVWGRKHLRKSTTAYTKDEMARLIEASQEAIHG